MNEILIARYIKSYVVTEFRCDEVRLLFGSLEPEKCMARIESRREKSAVKLMEK